MIGGQIWLTSNWKSTHYNGGTAIPNITDNSAWAALTTGGYCNYDNDPTNVGTSGNEIKIVKFTA